MYRFFIFEQLEKLTKISLPGFSVKAPRGAF
jgi:hypothetical protein